MVRKSPNGLKRNFSPYICENEARANKNVNLNRICHRLLAALLFQFLLKGSLSRFACLNSSVSCSSLAPFLIGVKKSVRLSFLIKHGLSLPSLVIRSRLQWRQNSVFSIGRTTSTTTSGK